MTRNGVFGFALGGLVAILPVEAADSLGTEVGKRLVSPSGCLQCHGAESKFQALFLQDGRAIRPREVSLRLYEMLVGGIVPGHPPAMALALTKARNELLLNPTLRTQFRDWVRGYHAQSVVASETEEFDLLVAVQDDEEIRLPKGADACKATLDYWTKVALKPENTFAQRENALRQIAEQGETAVPLLHGFLTDLLWSNRRLPERQFKCAPYQEERFALVVVLLLGKLGVKAREAFVDIVRACDYRSVHNIHKKVLAEIAGDWYR